MPEEGKSLLEASSFRQAMEKQAEEEGDGWRIPPFPFDALGVNEQSDIKWMQPRIQDHPLATMLQAVDTSSLNSNHIKNTFIRPTEGSASHIATIERIRAQGDWDYRELPTGHEAMVTMPEELAALLIEVAG